MPDWRELVRHRLQSLGVSDEREEEIRVELAEHLEDAHQDALRRGLTPEAALACAQDHVPSWKDLAGKIRRAGREEDAMTETAKTVWVPGTTALLAATLLLLGMVRIVGPAVWAAPDALWKIAIPWLLAYLLLGAAGAYWSRRAGGGLGARLLSGTFPLALHLGTFILPVMVSLFSETPKFPEHLEVAYLARISLIWVIIPGVALALGTLLFLRERAKA